MAQFRPGGFQILPPVIKNLIIINVLVFLATQTFGPVIEATMTNILALHNVQSAFFRPHQLVTYLFMHGGWQHIFFNMLALWMFGAQLENYWGAKRFLIFYMVSGIGAGIAHLAVLYFEFAPIMDQIHALPIEAQQQYLLDPNLAFNGTTVGASGAVFGCLAAFGYLFPNSEMIIIPIPFPLKAKWVVLGYAALELFSGVRGSAGDNVAHWAHLGGGLVGLLLVIYWNRNNRKTFY